MGGDPSSFWVARSDPLLWESWGRVGSGELFWPGPEPSVFGRSIMALSAARGDGAGAGDRVVRFEELLASRATWFPLHLPLNAETHHLIDAQALQSHEEGEFPDQHGARTPGGRGGPGRSGGKRTPRRRWTRRVRGRTGRACPTPGPRKRRSIAPYRFGDGGNSHTYGRLLLRRPLHRPRGGEGAGEGVGEACLDRRARPSQPTPRTVPRSPLLRPSQPPCNLSQTNTY